MLSTSRLSVLSSMTIMVGRLASPRSCPLLIGPLISSEVLRCPRGLPSLLRTQQFTNDMPERLQTRKTLLEVCVFFGVEYDCRFGELTKCFGRDVSQCDLPRTVCPGRPEKSIG